MTNNNNIRVQNDDYMRVNTVHYYIPPVFVNYFRVQVRTYQEGLVDGVPVLAAVVVPVAVQGHHQP